MLREGMDEAQPQSGARLLPRKIFHCFDNCLTPLQDTLQHRQCWVNDKWDHTSCLVRCISYLLFKSKKPGRTLRMGVGIASPSHLFLFAK